MTTVAAPPGLAALYAAHRHSLVRMAVLLVDDLASAEDVVQDAFVAFHRNAGQLHDPQAALGYLRVCVVNGARSMISNATPDAFTVVNIVGSSFGVCTHALSWNPFTGQVTELIRASTPTEAFIVVLPWGAWQY